MHSVTACATDGNSRSQNPLNGQLESPSSAVEELRSPAADLPTKPPATPLLETQEAPPAKTKAKRKTKPKKAKSPAAEQAPRPEFVVWVRGLHQTSAVAQAYRDTDPISALRKGLNATDFNDAVPGERIITWHDPQRLCALDADCHGKHELDELTAFQMECRFAVPPALAWMTHGRGLRAVYGAAEVGGVMIYANELAALAAVLMRQDWRTFKTYITGVELKTETRHPRYPKADGSMAGAVGGCGFQPVHTVMYAAARLFGRYDDGDAIEFDEDDKIDALREKGLPAEGRASHAYCLIDPTWNDPKRDCVVMLDRGVYCHSCNAKGLTYPGWYKPGYVPFALLINPDAGRPAFVPSAVAAMARRGTHWAHARPALRHLLGGGRGLEPLSDGILKLAYTASIKLWHVGYAQWQATRETPNPKFDRAKYLEGVQALTSAAFFPESPIYRGEDGGWYHVGEPGKPVSDKGYATIIAALPPAQFIDPAADGALKLSKRDHAYLMNNGPAGERGYFPLRALGAIDVFGLVGDVDALPNAAPFVVPMPRPFRYRTAGERERGVAGSSAEWWLEQSFPNIPMRAFKLALAAQMFAQLPNRTEPIRVMFVGQSGASKTTTIKLAASFLGMAVTTAQFTIDRDKWLRPFAAAATRGGVVLTDECAKSGIPASDMEALMLSVQKGENFHEMYKGATGLPLVGVHFLADTRVPDQFFASDQLARRTYLVELEAGAAGKDWLATSGGYADWRARDEINATVADHLVSAVMDDVRRCKSFEQYAEANGFAPLNKSKDYDRNASLRNLFIAYLNTPAPPDESDEVDAVKGGRWKGRGWQVFNPRKPAGDGSDAELIKAWRELEEEGGGTVDIQRITGCQWGVLLDVDGVACKCVSHGLQVGIRFHVGPVRASGSRFGADVLPPDHKLRAKVKPKPAVETVTQTETLA